MAPTPTLQELIAIVEADAAEKEPLGQLAQASATVAELADLGDELLEHFVARCRRQGHTWTEISGALGVTKQAAHKRFSLVQSPNLERFTPRARAALEGAHAEAVRLGHGYVGTEHLLLALFEPAESLASRLLADLPVTKAASEEVVLRIVGRGTEPADSTSERGFTDRAVESLRLAVEEALRLGHNYVGTEHMLLALFRDRASVAATALDELGVRPEHVSERVVAMLAQIRASLTERT